MGYSNRTWMCPYYIRDYKDHMSCEAGRIQLPDIRASQDYMAKYCSTYDWEDCSLACALTRYFEDKDREESRKNNE